MNSDTHNLRVALVWNGAVFEERSFAQTSEPVVSVGEDTRSTFAVPAPGLPDWFEMFERLSDGYTMRFTDKLVGSVHVDGEEFDVQDLIESNKSRVVETVSTEIGEATAFELVLRAGDWGVISLGKVNVFFQVLETSDRVAGRGASGLLDLAVMGFLLMAGLLHGGFLLWTFVHGGEKAHLDDFLNPDRFVRFMVDDVPDLIEEDDVVDEPADDTMGKRAGGEEGEFGDPDQDIPESQLVKNDADLVDEIDIKKVGVTVALGSELLGAGPLKNIFGNNEGFNAMIDTPMSGEAGDLVVGRGVGGMGLRGVEKGGGGEGFGRAVAVGGVDTGGGTGTSAGIATSEAKEIKPILNQGAPQVGDFCDAGNIRRVVNARANAIRHCFEQQLQTDPTLSGQIVAQWRIGLDGNVQSGSASVASSTMNNRAVEACITSVVSRMRFEKPDGGICVINYPFVFSSVE